MSKPMTKEVAKIMLASEEKSLHAFALEHYPELGDIKSRIKSVEDAYKELGKIREIPCGLTDGEIAYRDLCVVVEAFNEGWRPDFGDTDQSKYLPYFRGRKLETSTCVSICFSIVEVPAPTLVKSAELCEYIAENFSDLYRRWLCG